MLNINKTIGNGMKPWELYKHIRKAQYNVSGFDVDWLVEVLEEQKTVALLFKPSDSVQDWIVNVGGFMPTISFPIVYTFGWKRVFDLVKNEIMDEFIKQINEHEDYEVLVCGHSYGGAMSIVGALELYKRTKIKADVITFGAPKPLFLLSSKLLAKLRLGDVYQYRHKCDIVPYLPPILGYHNVSEVKLGKFKLKDLSKVNIYHFCYGSQSLYK